MSRLFHLLFFAFLILSACKKHDKKFLIDNNEYKYWRELDESRPSLSKTFYYFDKNGQWLVFTGFKDGRFALYDGGDVILPTRWELKNDSTLYTGIDNKIILLNDTSLIFSHPVTGTTILKACIDSLIPIEFRKIQTGHQGSMPK